MACRNARAAPDGGPPKKIQSAAKPPGPRSASTVTRLVDELAARRELRSWAAAAAWLNQHGCAAAVPGHLAETLRRRGLVVWAAGGQRTA